MKEFLFWRWITVMNTMKGTNELEFWGFGHLVTPLWVWEQ